MKTMEVACIAGPPSTGKSAAIKTLDPQSTLIISCADKRLPWMGSSKQYNKENKNLLYTYQSEDIIKALKKVRDEATHIKTVVIDDAQKIMAEEYMDRAKESGFVKFTEIGMHFRNVVDTARKLREDIVVFIIMHTEDIVTDKGIAKTKIKTVGKMVDQYLTPGGEFTLVAFSENVQEGGKVIPKFHVGNSTVTPARQPMGLFEEDTIPNDLKFMRDKIEECYAG